MKQFENPHFLSIIKHDSLGGYKADAAHCNVGGCVDKKPKLKQKSEGCFNEKLSNKAGVRNADAEHGDGRGDVDKKPKFKKRLAVLCSQLRIQQW